MTAALPHVLGRSEDTAGDLRCFLGSPQVLATQPLLLHSLVSVPATRPCPVHSHHVPPRPPFCCLPCLQPSALPECQSHVARAPGPASQGPALLAQRVPSPAHLPVPTPVPRLNAHQDHKGHCCVLGASPPASSALVLLHGEQTPPTVRALDMVNYELSLYFVKIPAFPLHFCCAPVCVGTWLQGDRSARQPTRHLPWALPALVAPHFQPEASGCFPAASLA